MKKQNVLIAYVNNGDIKSISKRERAFKAVIQQMTDAGLKLSGMTKNSKSQTANFHDGSKVKLISFGVSVFGERFTHIFVDEEIMDVPNGQQYVSQVLFPQIMIKSQNGYEVSDSFDNRIQFFTLENKSKISFKALRIK